MSATAAKDANASKRAWLRRLRLATEAWAGLIVALGLALIWEISVAAFRLPIWLLPSPHKIAIEIANIQTFIWYDVFVTASEAFFGLLLAIAVSVVLATAIAFVPWFARGFYPIIVALQTVPKVALAPLFVVWFGAGFTSKILLACLVAFFPLTIDLIHGLKSINQDYIAMAKTMKGSTWTTFRWIRIPAALPSFFSGLKVAGTFAVLGAIVGEFIGADRGLGYQMLTAFALLDTVRIFAIIVLMSAVGGVFFLVLDILERLVIPWHVSHRAMAGNSGK